MKPVRVQPMTLSCMMRFKTNLVQIIIMTRQCVADNSWLVGCFGLNGPLRQYFSLYRAVSQREGERKEK